MRIFVTGTGVISAIGLNTAENLESLKAGKSGIGKITLLDTVHRKEIPAAEVKLNDEEILKLAVVGTAGAYTRTALLGIKAASEAVNQAGKLDKRKFRTALISATTVAGMGKSEIYYGKYLKENFSNEYIKTHEAADSSEKIADFLGIKDFVTTVSTACSSAANAVMFGARLIKNGIVDRAVVGGADSLSKFTINGFNTLMILDKNPCRPFDNTRQGLNMGEGAGFLVLDSEQTVKTENLKPLAELTGYGNANDAYHQTASSPDGYGPYLAMKAALEISGFSPKDIDYVNVHGTGTPNNDLSEGWAMLKLFGGIVPPFSSTKANTGHTLAAAGGIEAVFSILSLQHNLIFPNLNFTEKMSEFDLIPNSELQNTEVIHVLSNSFGFGGNDTSLIFSKAY
jgi:3-oxoacyl-[acyl-carrier-protein] synthase-1